jgi:tight adherence protein B
VRAPRAIGGLLGLALIAAAPAQAATGLRLSEASGGHFPQRSYALTLPAPRALDTGSVRVTENGRAVEALDVLPPGGASAHRFGVVLAIDVSHSMRGRPLRAAVTAARRFVRHRNAGQPVAIVSFAGETRVVQPFTSDGPTIDRALAGIHGERGPTHLVDAVGQAIALISSARIDSGSLVVLSDGGDHGSLATRERVTKAASAAGVRIFAIGLPSPDNDFGPLNLLAAGTQGEFSSAASIRDLTRIYDRLGSRLAGQYLLRYRSAAGPHERIVVDVRVAGLTATASAVYDTPAGRAAAHEPFHRSHGSVLWRSAVAVVLASLIAALLVGCAVWLLVRPRGLSTRARMAAYVDPPPEAGVGDEGDLKHRVVQGATNSLDATAWGVRLKDRLDIARIMVPPAQLAAWVVAGTLILLLALTMIGGPLLGLLAFGAPAATWALISRRVREQRLMFRDQLPDNLQIIASAMRAGHSFSGALSVVAEDAAEPTQREFTRVLADERLGVPLDEALQVVVERMASKDFEQVALVAALQRETGGNTAEVLDRVTDTVRDRVALQRMIKTLTAQGRMSRWVVSGLPVVLLLAITLINPEYMRPLYNEPLGRALLVLASAMVVSGSLVIKRIVDIKV